MEFRITGKKVAGSAAAIMEDRDVRDVMSAFGDGCLECYKMDIRDNPRAFLSSRQLRQVRSFVSEYGRDDALRIVERLFEQPHNGSYRGAVIGQGIFANGYRWLANMLLMEKSQNEGSEYRGISWSKW